MPHKLKSMEDVGRRFGRLTVIGVGSPDAGRARRLICRCDCGAVKAMQAAGIRQGRSISCGCVRAERVLAAIVTHGRSQSLTYKSYKAMLSRCYDPRNASYPSYGACGVTVCARWRESIAAFIADMGERPSKGHSIDRIDNAKGYEPGNCRWATAIGQQANRSVTKRLTAFGVTLPLAEWVRRSNLPHQTIRQRLRAGMSPEMAVTIPGRKHGIQAT
jgi:hypothetical protein